MILSEQFDRITSNEQEHDLLYESDNLYIAWVAKKDDPKLKGFVDSIDEEYYTWRNTLNGSTKRGSKLGNPETEKEELRGYIYSVTTEQVDMFEKIALMPSMKYGYRFEKLDINQMKDKEKQEIIEVLSEENE
jgi:hypothetical protein